MKLLDGRWKYVGVKDSKYVFENIYNHNIIALNYRTYKNIVEGKDTISKHISRIIAEDGGIVYNTVHKQDKYRRYYHATKKVSD